MLERALILLATAVAARPAPLPAARTHVNSIGMKLVRIEPGAFRMGETAELSEGLVAPLGYFTRKELAARYPWGDPARFRYHFDYARRGDFDEHPAHMVRITRPFYLAVLEVTNAQYELFDPGHRDLRGKRGFSRADDEAVIFVNWHEAKAFCEWLSRKEGLPYRLPTEAEWEFAARAGTASPYPDGAVLPEAALNNARSTEWTEKRDLVSLAGGRTPPNAWGLYDMHGNVEEWTEDWYGPYAAGEQRDPVGRAGGDFKVTRGGSHGTVAYYLRSANRMGALPETRSWITGFRVALGPMPATKPLPAPPPPRAQANVRQGPPPAAAGSAAPFFRGPRRFIRIPPGRHGPLYSYHNHDTAIAECPNGDILAIWYTCEQERGRELAVAQSRLRAGAAEWEEASPFWDAPDRNDHCPALWFDGDKTLYHINGYGIAGRWTPLAIVLRTSTDNGATWSPARLIEPEFGFRMMVGEPVFRTASGALVFGADAQGNSTVYVSRDNGLTWRDMGGNIPGVHAAIAELRDGRLLAFGRNANLGGWMPRSVSADLGGSWTSAPSVFPPINGGQRAALLRLREGPLMMASFATGIDPFRPVPPGERPPRHLSSIFVALSYDEGVTWPVRRIVSTGREHGFETFDGGWIRMAADRSEPQGYLAATQARNGTIHLVSSVNHYEFNKAWIEERQPPPPPLEPAALPSRFRLAGAVKARYAAGPGRYSNERSGEFETLDPRRGFTVEVRAAGPVEFEVYASSGPLIATHYALRVTAEGVEYWHDNRFTRIAGGVAGGHTYRLAVRGDTAVEIYRGAELLAVCEADIVIGRGQPVRGPYVSWTGAGAAVAYDLAGAYRPGNRLP